MSAVTTAESLAREIAEHVHGGKCVEIIGNVATITMLDREDHAHQIEIEFVDTPGVFERVDEVAEV